MSRIASFFFAIVGVIHLLPLPGILGGKMLAKLYGIEIQDPNLFILLQHRAVLLLSSTILIFLGDRIRP